MDPGVDSQLELTCRTCGICDQSGKFTHLFKPATELATLQLEILEIANFFELNISNNDGLPQQICAKCTLTFSDIQLFVTDCLAVQAELKVCFQKTTPLDETNSVGFQDVEFLESESLFEQMHNDTTELNDDHNNDTDESTGIVNSTRNCSTQENSIICHETEVEVRTAEDNSCDDDLDHFSDSNYLGTDNDNNDDDDSDNDDTDSDNNKNDENETNITRNLISNSAKKKIPQCRLCFRVFITEMELEKHKLKCFEVGRNRKICRYCRTVYESYEEREIHLKKYHSNRHEHICSICGITVRLVADLRLHLASHNSETLKCASCELEFKNRFRFNEHVRKEHSAFECSICRKQFKKAIRFKYHIQSHRPEKKFKCQYCERTFMQKHHLETHESIHTGLYPYLCNVCGKEFRQYANFKKHLKKHVGEKDAYVCKSCDKSFLVEETYLCHLRSHMTKTTYDCTTCNLSFAFKRSLMNHNFSIHKIALEPCDSNEIVIDDKSYDYKCPMCTLTFKLPQALATHIKTHTEKRPFICDLCKRCFKREQNLKTHKQNVHLKLRPFRCDQCGRYFGRNYELTAHMKIHSEERPYKCSQCDKCFKTKPSYRLHLRIHGSVMQFKCEICGDVFRWHSSLKAHMNRKHTNEQLDSVHNEIISGVCKIVEDS